MSRSIPLDAPNDFAPLLALERVRLFEDLPTLGSAEWGRATPCPGWSVLDLAVHLLGDDLAYVAGHRDGHTPARPPDGDEDGFIDWLDRLQDDWVRTGRRLSPALTLELLRWTGPQLEDVVAAEDPTEPAASVSWASREPVPRWLDHARELSERWIHRQQIRDALDRRADLRLDLLVPVLDALRWAYPFRLEPHRRPAGSAVGIVVADSDASLRWRLMSDGTRWEFAVPGELDDRPGADVPSATLGMTPDQAWRLLTNNLDARRDGRPSVSGDPDLVDALLVMTRAIIGRPRPVA